MFIDGITAKYYLPKSEGINIPEHWREYGEYFLTHIQARLEKSHSKLPTKAKQSQIQWCERKIALIKTQRLLLNQSIIT